MKEHFYSENALSKEHFWTTFVPKTVSMLLKWLFTALAILWLFQALRPFFGISQSREQRKNPPPPPPGPNIQKRADDDDGEYIDYEEVKK